MTAVRSGSGSSKSWSSCGSGAARWALALVLAGTAASGCWLDRVVDVPTVEDAGTRVTDAAATDSTQPGTTWNGSQWVTPSKGGCALTSVSCDQLAACPPSWMQANSPGSCPQAGAQISAETCEGMYRWSLSSADGTLAVVCYYDMAGGLLAGIASQIALPCGTNSQFGTVPQLCHYDAGVVQQRFTCAPGGGGVLTDGGSSLSCSQEMPCYGGG